MRTVIIASAAAALFSSPAFTQQPSQGTASIPDFSGIWGRLAVSGFEPLLSGPGPVQNLSRVTIEVVGTLAPSNGAVTADASPNGMSSIAEPVGDFTQNRGLQRSWTAARVYGRGPGRVHNLLVSQDYLSGAR
jgi:hypothetical protein